MLPQNFVPKKISDLKETDMKVSIMGKVSSKSDNSFVIDDGSGKIEVSSGYPVNEGDLVRVYCTATEGKLKAEAVQSLNGLDLNLYHKVEGLYRKAGV